MKLERKFKCFFFINNFSLYIPFTEISIIDLFPVLQLSLKKIYKLSYLFLTSIACHARAQLSFVPTMLFLLQHIRHSPKKFLLYFSPYQLLYFEIALNFHLKQFLLHGTFLFKLQFSILVLDNLLFSMAF